MTVDGINIPILKLYWKESNIIAIFPWLFLCILCPMPIEPMVSRLQEANVQELRDKGPRLPYFNLPDDVATKKCNPQVAGMHVNFSSSVVLFFTWVRWNTPNFQYHDIGVYRYIPLKAFRWWITHGYSTTLHNLQRLTSGALPYVYLPICECLKTMKTLKLSRPASVFCVGPNLDGRVVDMANLYNAV